ncbi:MAG: acyl-CoA dehydrogenase, partial [Salinisphaeraceae bacterium]|nr:acyl-CoA dehydrogenase [Salinisphaeraceae bacterium]
ASGEFVPCFGLTEPTAGSDAASINADGEVFKDDDGEVKIRMNFRKRYITMAPIANLISVATVLRDPDNLLGKGENPGITVVLVEKGTPGLTNGDRHWPIGDPFYNGPIIGKDVVVPADDIVGGRDYAGQGWRMLMEQLAGGRAVSLPAGAVGGAKAAAAVTGAYSMVRQQFGMPIGQMEGIEIPVARIAGMSYLMDAAHQYALGGLNKGIAPPVISAILKQQTTEIARELSIDAMDVFSGSGVMQGPNNIVGLGYQAAPVSITVEGANIMTRTLMIFGQGATRCHPYAQKVLNAVDAEDVSAFRGKLLGWLGHIAMTFGRVFFRGITRGWIAGSPVGGPTATYFRRLSWSASRFALLTNMAMMLMGSKLKARGRLTGRYADVLSWMYMGFATLQRWEVEGRKAEDLPVVQYAMDTAMAKIQEGFEGIYANFDAPVVGLWLRTVGRLMLRMNPIGTGPSDQLTQEAARSIQSLSGTYERITQGVFNAPEETPGAGRLRKAFRLVLEAQPVLAKITAAQKARKLPRAHAEEVAEQAAEAGIISAEELALVNEMREARLAAIEVDVFPFDLSIDKSSSTNEIAEAA